MWDNAALLKSIANMLLAFSVLAMLYGALHYIVHLPGLSPLHSVRLSAAPQRVDAPEILRVVRGELRGNFFTADIGQLRQSLEKLPWVRSVSIRRKFPGSLTVQLEEHQALARWNNSALVNRQGEVFGADTDQELPDFIGQAGVSKDVAQHFAQFSQQLDTLNLRVTRIALNARRAWQLRLSNGMVLELGHEDTQQRLARFVAAYPYTGDRGAAEYVDLRYRNGFAARQKADNEG